MGARSSEEDDFGEGAFPDETEGAFGTEGASGIEGEAFGTEGASGTEGEGT